MPGTRRGRGCNQVGGVIMTHSFAFEWAVGTRHDSVSLAKNDLNVDIDLLSEYARPPNNRNLSY